MVKTNQGSLAVGDRPCTSRRSVCEGGSDPGNCSGSPFLRSAGGIRMIWVCQLVNAAARGNVAAECLHGGRNPAPYIDNHLRFVEVIVELTKRVGKRSFRFRFAANEVQVESMRAPVATPPAVQCG